MFFQNCTRQFWVTVACTCQFSAILILTTTFLHFAHSQKFTVTFITKMCLSPAHFHQFLHPSIDSHYEGPAKSGMIVEIQGHPKHLLMPNCLGIVINVPQTITIFVGVRIFLWCTLYAHTKFLVGVHGRTLYAHKKLLGFCLWAYMYAHVRPWAYNYVGVQIFYGRTMYAHGRTGRTGCNLWAYWAYMGVQGRTWA